MDDIEDTEYETLISLNMKDVIPLARKAFDEKTLQCFTAPIGTTCSYAGPCAIGAAIPDNNLRLELDGHLAGCDIDSLMISDVIRVPRKQYTDFSILQEAHDQILQLDEENRAEGISELDKQISILESKYLK